MIIERERGFLIFLFCAPFLKESDVLPYIAFFIVARGIRLSGLSVSRASERVLFSQSPPFLAEKVFSKPESIKLKEKRKNGEFIVALTGNVLYN